MGSQASFVKFKAKFILKDLIKLFCFITCNLIFKTAVYSNLTSLGWQQCFGCTLPIQCSNSFFFPINFTLFVLLDFNIIFLL